MPRIKPLALPLSMTALSLALGASTGAWAAEPRQMVATENQNHEIVGGASVLSLGGDPDFGFDFTVGYAQIFPNALSRNLQFEGDVVMSLRDTVKIYRFLIGPTFNYALEGGLENAYFFTAQGGLSVVNTDLGASGSETDTSALWNVGVGKRFRINSNVSWRPAVNLTNESVVSPNKTSVNIIPIQFSFFWG